MARREAAARERAERAEIARQKKIEAARAALDEASAESERIAAARARIVAASYPALHAALQAALAKQSTLTRRMVTAGVSSLSLRADMERAALHRLVVDDVISELNAAASNEPRVVALEA